MKIDPAIQREIDASGLPFRFEEGKRHIKLMLGGEMVTVFSRKPNERGGRAVKNLVGHIRRKVRQVKQTDEPQPIPAPVVKLPEARAIPAIAPQVPEKGETNVTTKTNSTPVDGILMSRAVSGVVVYLPNGSPVITELAPRPLRGSFDELGRFVVSPGSGGSTGFWRVDRVFPHRHHGQEAPRHRIRDRVVRLVLYSRIRHGKPARAGPGQGVP